ncbi:MAG: ABC transporter substrate-binding protein [Acidimicrobiales bacterium]|nr:ABC transporter substrate-binding protein [Acidimicrobiales bacterium]
MRRRFFAVLTIAVLLAAACSEADPETEAGPSDDPVDSTDTGTDTDTDTDTDTEPQGDGTSIVERLAGEEWFLGTIPNLPVEADNTLEPIKIGMINLEDSPAGSFPELRYAAEASINFINSELGGVDGRPIEFYPCVVNFSVESSQACAQELVLEEVVALVGGIDVLVHGALPVLEENGLPIVGGIPAGLAEQRNPISFAFSGGTAGGMAAFMQHAVDQGYEKAYIAYGDFESFAVAAEEYGAGVGRSLGLEVRTNAFPLFGADYIRVLNDAKSFGAEAVIINAADAACVPVMQGFRDLGFEGTLYMFGACAGEEIIEAADGANIGVVYNSEGPPDSDDVEGELFDLASNEYNTGNAQAAGTVAFRGMMNLYAVLQELGGDSITSAGVVSALQNSVDRESFWGHNYTCDGNQVPGLPSLCAPQQTLMTINGSTQDDLEFITDWIDTVALFEAAFAE